MKNEINTVLKTITVTTQEKSDYTGEDGLLYCGKCHKPKEAYFPEGKALFGLDRHPAECDCQRAAREEREAAEQRRRHLDSVEELKRRGFTDPTMRDWTFLKTTTAGTRRPNLPAGMWSIGRICEPTISAACSGAAWEPAKATLRAVSQTPSWRKKSLST